MSRGDGSIGSMEPSTFWTAVSAVSTALAAIVAIVALLGVRRDSRDQTRPYLQAQVVPSVGGSSAADLIIRNTGRTPARRVIIEADPWPAHHDDVTDELRRFFGRPHTIAPGATLRAYWAMNLGDVKNQETGELEPNLDPKKDPAGFTTPTLLTLRYDGRMGRSGCKRKYVDEYDIHMFAKVYVPAGGAGFGPEKDGDWDIPKTLIRKIGDLTAAVNMTRWHN